MYTPLKSVTLRVAALTLLFAVSHQAFAVDFDKSVFEYQHKLANSGNAEAQYYLAQMYEEGRGTVIDHEMAKQWYEKARQNGFNLDEKRTPY